MKILKNFKLSGAMLGLTVLLTACPGDITPTPTFDLKVALAGVSSAPVTVTNTTTGAELFKGTLDASKTFAGLTANDVLKVEGGNVAGYTTPVAQTVTLDASKTVTLTYAKPTPAPNYDLTVNLSGVSSAPVTVTNTATNAEVFKGTLNASKTFTGLPANSVLKVEGGAVDGYITPAAQTITLDANKTVGLTYTKPAPAPTFDLTVNLGGIPSAPVTVTNTATNAEVFKGTLDASKTFTGLAANSVLKVEGGAVADFAAPAAQTVTLDASKSVSLTYTALAGTALDAARVKGTIPGWTAGTGKIAFELSNGRTTVDGNPADISAGGTLKATLPTPVSLAPFLDRCTLSAGTTGSDFRSEFARPIALNSAGSVLGEITETTSIGIPVTRVYAQTATTLKGTAFCGSARIDLDFTVNVGWNALSIVRTESGSTTLFTIRNIPSDARIQLGFVAEKPSIFLNPTDYSEIILRAGTSVTRQITLTPRGAVSGIIDLSTSLPGVKVTPATINLGGTNALSAQSTEGLGLILQAVRPQALTTTVTFSLTEQATDYSGPLALIASQGGTELGRTQLPAIIRLPSVNVYVANFMSGVDAYQGGTASISVNVSPQEGFSGNVTLSLTDLPAGVTASPVTVNVSANATTTVAIPMQVAADAPLGTTQVKVTGDKVPVNNNGMPNVFQLSIKPARTSLGILSYNTLAPASNGVWVISGYNYANGGFQATLRRIANGQNVKEVTLGDVSNFLLAIPGGDVYAIGTDFRNNNIIYRVKDDGTSSALTTTTTAGMSNGVVDDQGRIWFVATLDGSTGASTYGLFQWNPVTGARTLVDGSRTYTPNNRLVVSNNGLYVLYGPEYNGTPILINTSTSATSPVANPSGNSIGSAAVSNTGQVWYSSNGGLTRINSDGTATTFTVSGGSVSRITGFDQNNANTLWATGYNSIIKVDAVSGTTSLIPTDSIERSVVNTKGGVSILASGRPKSGGLEYFLSVLP
ncbi:hypothetical protein E7T06_11050 [Deinococcus sp. Arct2-2]|uniref:hypothetical protein n=1 Tax=Deinococcus sp. Arct2-2 TaxID=2568653 RepID=UPI0010A2F86D|nr:hypothetical protein [Deinococcus sp. Arct2-2]THF69670.1 hypothetical protein E7T06_11050 [Deinococcus sp. Arct2-2]